MSAQEKVKDEYNDVGGKFYGWSARVGASNPQQSKVLTQVIEERLRQDAKFGVQDHDSGRWLMILMEEVGEAAKELTQATFARTTEERAKHLENFEVELTQSAAVCVAWLEARLRQREYVSHPVQLTALEHDLATRGQYAQVTKSIAARLVIDEAEAAEILRLWRAGVPAKEQPSEF